MAVAVLALAGCGGDDDEGGDAADDTTTSSEADEATVEQDVVEAYEAHWQALIDASDPPDPEAAGLDAHVTGEALTNMRSFLARLKAEGVVVRGTYEFDARAIEVGDDSAVVEDCGLDQMEGVLAASGEVVEPYDDQRDGIVAELVKEDGTWKVTSVRDDEQVCA